MFLRIYQGFLKATPKKDVLFLFILFAALYFGLSTLRPLANPDEGRYVEIPREMLVTGNWITPRLNGILYFEKPPAFYWLQALSLKIGGVHEGVARFWNCSFALLGVLATYATASMLYGRKVGLLAALFLGLSPIYFAMGHVITLDMMFSCCIAFGFFAFIKGDSLELSHKTRFWWFMGFYGALSLGVLTKGLVALLVPGAILLLWMAVCHEWRVLRHLYILPGLILSLCITVPWHILAALETPEFAYFYLVHEQFLRYLKPLHGRGQPFWFFTAMLLVGFLPWSIILISYFKKVLSSPLKILRGHRIEALLLIWGVFFVVFFSCSKSQLVPYILPSFFPFAVLVAAMVEPLLSRAEQLSSYLKIAFTIYASSLLIAALALPAVLLYEGLPRGCIVFACVLSAILVVLALLKLQAIRQHKIRDIVILMVMTFVLIAASCNFLLRYARPSTKPFALYLKPLLRPGDGVFQVYNYYQDFPAYLEQLTGVVDRPDEQKFGLSLEDHSDRYPTEADFFKQWRSSNTMYALIRAKHLERFIQTVHDPVYTHILMQDKEYVLLKNKD
jgi:4-amino-4-deoxy-L-arabinose transferase-like glycosyltransferase